MALGGVATGTIKAYDADTVAGIIRYRGCTQRSIAYNESSSDHKRFQNKRHKHNNISHLSFGKQKN